MILPIFAYGHPVLKKVCKEIPKEDKELSTLVENMWETMYNAQGVGLAAPQIGKPIRLFLIDTVQIEEDEEDFKGIKEVFINAKIVSESGDFWAYEEGCLSIPQIRGDVERQDSITIEYQNAAFEKHSKTFTGINARVIQHEYDHIEGKLFIEQLKPLKKRRIKRKLENIKKGDIKVNYRMKFV